MLIIKAAFFISIFTMVLVLILLILDKKVNSEVHYEKSIIKRINVYLSKGGNLKDWYSKIEKYLKSTGTTYGLNVEGYMLLKIVCSAAFLVLSRLFNLNIIATLILTVIGFFILNIRIHFKDKKETKEINLQMKDIYDSLKLQTISGTYVIAALSDCYLIVTNERLKKALAFLSARISYQKDINAALTDFQERFRSDEINNLVLIIKQSLKTGKLQEQLDSQTEELNDLSQVAAKEFTQKINNTIDEIQLFEFLGLFIVILYYCAALISSNSTNLF